MNTFARAIALAVLALAAFSGSASAGVADDPLIGKWRTANGAIVEFTPGTAAPIEGHTIAVGRGVCERNDYNLRMTPTGNGRYEGRSNNYSVSDGTCGGQIEDATVVLQLASPNPNTLTYTFTPAEGRCEGTCTEQWTRVIEPPQLFGCPPRGLTGTDGDDTLTGTEAGDTIAGGNGNDSISGLGGPDCLFGENGNNTIDGGDGNDQIFAHIGSDTGSGGNGNDIIILGRGSNRANGGAGDDFILDRGRRSLIRAGTGADIIRVDGPATIHPGPGIDYVHARNGQRDRIDCRGDADALTVDRTDRVSRCRGVRVIPPSR